MVFGLSDLSPVVQIPDSTDIATQKLLALALDRSRLRDGGPINATLKPSFERIQTVLESYSQNLADQGQHHSDFYGAYQNAERYHGEDTVIDISITALIAEEAFYSLLLFSNNNFPDAVDIQSWRCSLHGNFQQAFSRTHKSNWAAVSPETYLWVCVLGAALAYDQETRRFWVAEMIPATVTLQANEVRELYLDAWLHFRWLRGLSNNNYRYTYSRIPNQGQI